MKILVAVPLGRSANTSRVASLWRVQTETSELLFAPAEGVNVSGGLTCRPTRTIGEARNAALEVARSNAFDLVIFWDDDDYYGPGYVREFREALEREPEATVLFKPLAFVRHDDGLWLYDETKTQFFPGHSTAVRPSKALPFPAASLSEDVAWSRLMRGEKSLRLSPWHLVYDRQFPWEHAYSVPREIFLRQHGPAKFVGEVANEVVNSPFSCETPWIHSKPEDVFLAMRRGFR